MAAEQLGSAFQRTKEEKGWNSLTPSSSWKLEPRAHLAYCIMNQATHRCRSDEKEGYATLTRYSKAFFPSEWQESSQSLYCGKNQDEMSSLLRALRLKWRQD